MAKSKAELLVKASELGLEFTQDNTVAEITAGIESADVSGEAAPAIVAENTSQLTDEQVKAGWFVSEWGELRAPTVQIGNPKGKE